MDDNFLPARKVWERYGVTSMTLHRWQNDPDMRFPKPVYMGRLRFWPIADLEQWEQKRPRLIRRAPPGHKRKPSSSFPKPSQEMEATLQKMLISLGWSPPA